MNIERIVREYCEEKKLNITISSNMPHGYEDAYGTYDVVKNTIYINLNYIKDLNDYEVMFYIFHELRHSVQYNYPNKFSDEIKESLAYVILYNGVCYYLCDNAWKKCELDGEEDVMLNLTTAKELIYSKTTDENDVKYIDKYTVENAKSIYRDKIESIIRILGLDGYTVDDFVSYVSEYETYTDADGVEHKEICGIALECQLAVDTNLECEGVIPFVRLDIDANGEINNLFYLDKSVEKIDFGYELKDMEEIISDIENDNNVLTENVTGTGEDVVLEDVEMKMYSEGAGTAQKYMIPYYYITCNENGNEVEIIMPAIKNEYLKVN